MIELSEWRPEDVQMARHRVDAFLTESLAREQALHAASTVYAPLLEDLSDLLLRPGKRIRPLSYLLAARAFAPATPWLHPSRIAVAASLEMLHAFVLIHDDLIDRSETRRGQPSLHRMFERRVSTFADRQRTAANLALVMGDILFAMGQRTILQSGEPRAAVQLAHLLEYIIETGIGEASDIAFGTRDIGKVSLDDIERMYLQKTTRYTVEAPLVLAALLADASDLQLTELGAIVAPAGLAFQIQNDLREFEVFERSDAEIPADLLEGKKTYLMRTAFELLNEVDQGILQLCLNGIRPSEATVSKVRELVAKSGAVGRLREAAEVLCARSVRLADVSSFPPDVRAGLSGILHLLCALAQGVRSERAVA